MMCLNGTFGATSPHERSARPTAWAHMAMQPSIELKFHHVISWDNLRDTWQTLLEFGQWATLEAFMTAVGVTGASGLRGKLHRGESWSSAERDEIFERVSWPGWNIVQGPGNRTDEGGKDIDLFSEGMPALDKERHVTLGLLWLEMKLLLDAAGASGAAAHNLRSNRNTALNVLLPARVHRQHNARVADAASRLERALISMSKFKSASYLPYIHSMWDTVSAGAVNKTASAMWDAVPAYRKASSPRAVIGNLPALMRCTRCAKSFPTPAVSPGVKVYCPNCQKQTMVDFANAA